MTSDHERLEALRNFAARYTAAWCSQDPASVAESLGHYDAAEYQRQIEHGAE